MGTSYKSNYPSNLALQHGLSTPAFKFKTNDVYDIFSSLNSCNSTHFANSKQRSKTDKIELIISTMLHHQKQSFTWSATNARTLYKLDCTKKPGKCFNVREKKTWNLIMILLLKDESCAARWMGYLILTLQVFSNFSTDFDMYLFFNQSTTCIYTTYQMWDGELFENPLSVNVYFHCAIQPGTR